MKQHSIWPFLLGMVQFTAQGGDAARFLNLCAAAGVSLERLRANPLGFTGWVPARQYRRLHHPARRCRVRVRVVRRVGAGFRLHRLRGRWGLVVGVLCFFALCTVLTGCIWTVTYYELPAAQAAQLAPRLAAHGLVRGSRPTAGQLALVRQQILLEDPSLASLSFQFVRGRLVVQAAQAEEKPAITDNTTPMDIVAGKDGVLESVQVYSGFAVRAVGQSVHEGELLVSHSYTDAVTGNTTTGYAHADVMARTETVFTCQQPLTQTVQVPTGRVYSEVTFCTGGLQLPLFRETPLPAAYTETTTLLSAQPFGWALPCFFRVHTVTELTLTDVTYTEQAALDRAKLACDQQIAQQFAKTQILSRQVQTDAAEGVVRYTVTVSAIEQIGRTVTPVEQPAAPAAPEQGG